MKKISITKRFNFEAAHKLPDSTIYGKCSQLHGHRYVLEVTISGGINEYGWIVNFDTLKEVVTKNILEMMDHKYLNDVISPIPTVENIADHIFTFLRETYFGPSLSKIKLYETETSFCEVENV